MPGRPEMTDVPSAAALPPGAVARVARASDRIAADRPAPGKPSRPSGAASRSTTPGRPARTSSLPRALDAARARTSFIEPHQSFDHQRLWADLLWSPAMAFNLFGDLAADLGLADRAVHAWWPDAPGTVSDVRFAHSPGRLDPAYLGQPPRLRRRVRARPRRRNARDRRDRRQVPRVGQARDPEAEQAVALPGGRRAVGRVRARGDRRGQRERPRS